MTKYLFVLHNDIQYLNHYVESHNVTKKLIDQVLAEAYKNSNYPYKIVVTNIIKLDD